MTSALSNEQGLSPEPRISPELISKQEQTQGKSKFTSIAIAELMSQPLKSGLQVVHATPGRVRFRTNDTNLRAILGTISQQLRQQDGVYEVRSNQQTGSLVVSFAQNKLSLPQMLEVFQQFGVSDPQTPLPEAKQTDPFAAWQSIDFWKEQGISLIPLITGLLVTGRLGIHGLPAIPVYLITASATRQMIDHTRNQGTWVGDRGDEYSAESGQVIPDLLVVQPAKIEYSVVHAISGRIRFHVPRLAQDQAYAQQLQRLLKADAQTTSFRVKRAAASILITYEPGVILDAQMQSRSVSERVLHWVGLIQKAGEAISQTKSTMATEQPTPESASAWADLKPPALTASLEFMANLPAQAVAE